jgi:hypothetical protein
MLVGVSTQLSLAWKTMRAHHAPEPDYSEVIEGLGAVSLGIDSLITELGCDSRRSADLSKLTQARSQVEQATALLLYDLRERDFV